MTALLLVVGLVLFIGLVVVHEFGHFIMARRGGVSVEEFGIGFPPTIWKKRIKSPKGAFKFTINALPLGGFVRLKGEHDADKSPGSFGAAPLMTKVKIMVAGVLMNLITAVVLLTALALIGLPKLIDNQFTVKRDTKVVKDEILVGFVEAGSPAAKAGLQAGDQLLNIQANGHTTAITSATNLPALTKSLAGQQASVTIKRGGVERQLPVTLRASDEATKDGNKAYLGIANSEYAVQRSTWSAPVVALGLSAQVTKLTLSGFVNAIKGLGSTIAGVLTGNSKARQAGQSRATEQVGGPVAIFFILQSGAHEGLIAVLLILAIISLTLAIMNVLPIPALDGGRLFVTLLFRAMRRPLRQNTEDLIHGLGFVILILLFLLITIVDVKRFF